MSVLIDLDFPVVVDGETVSSVRLRRPVVRDMLRIDIAGCSDAEKELALFANLCEMTNESLENLDLSDYAKLQRAYQDFLS